MKPTNRPEDPCPDDEALLHGLVDGQLDADALRRAAGLLHRDPQAARRAAAWLAQRRALRRLARDLPLEDAPPALGAVLPQGARRRWTREALAAGVLLACGIGIGWWAQGPGGAGDLLAARDTAASAPRFVRDAKAAHAVFVPEQRHPVEVTAADEAHLVQWLSRRLGAPLKVPSLADEGYRLLGGRLLPGDGAPRAQFMYEDAGGQRVTLFVAVFAAGKTPAPVSFRLLREGATGSFYWIDGDFGYALSADLPIDAVQRLARRVHSQLQR